MANKKPEVYDRLDALEKQVRDLKNKDNEEIKEVNFEEVLFDKEKYHVGQAKVNEKISKGFQIFRQFTTESGIVVELAMWKGKK